MGRYAFVVKQAAAKLGWIAWARSVWRVFRSADTPVWAKALFGALALAYIVVPFDFDFVPVLGWIDDAVVSAVLLWLATKFAPEAARQHHRKQVENERLAKAERDATAKT